MNTPELISSLLPHQVFVFGSNTQGAHYGGAARIAHEKFGAEWNLPEGPSGQTYAIPTIVLEEGKVLAEALQESIERFIDFAAQHPEQTFLLTKIGCGIAGWHLHEVRDLLWAAVAACGREALPENVVIPWEFER